MHNLCCQEAVHHLQGVLIDDKGMSCPLCLPIQKWYTASSRPGVSASDVAVVGTPVAAGKQHCTHSQQGMGGISHPERGARCGAVLFDLVG